MKSKDLTPKEVLAFSCETKETSPRLRIDKINVECAAECVT